MSASNPKEAKLGNDANKSVSSLDVSASQSVLEDVDRCQNELDALNEKACDEILAVEEKYSKLRRPHYDKRNKVIDGIPDFWYNAFMSHPHIAAMLSNEEQDCLRSLLSVNVEEFEDITSGYKITFTFKENSYFTNKELVKEFHLASSGEHESKSTPIDWNDGKDLTKQEARSKGRKRQSGDHSRFFIWFVSNGDPNLDEIAETRCECRSTFQHLHPEVVQQFYETIKNDIWVNPLHYYLASEIEVGTEDGHSDNEDDDSVEDEDFEDLEESVAVTGDGEEEEDDGEELEIDKLSAQNHDKRIGSEMKENLVDCRVFIGPRVDEEITNLQKKNEIGMLSTQNHDRMIRSERRRVQPKDKTKNKKSLHDKSTVRKKSKPMKFQTGAKPFKCSVCAKPFKQKSNCKTHMRLHTGEKPFKCTVCDKAFYLKNNLQSHLRFHTGEKPFKCSVCDSAFSVNSNLTQHMRLHTGEKPFNCTICTKTFSRSNDLTLHMRFHKGYKPFKCTVCNKSFVKSSHLTSHKRIHTGDKPFECTVCNKAFTQKGNLNKHMVKVHIVC